MDTSTNQNNVFHTQSLFNYKTEIKKVINSFIQLAPVLIIFASYNRAGLTKETYNNFKPKQTEAICSYTAKQFDLAV